MDNRSDDDIRKLEQLPPDEFDVKHLNMFYNIELNKLSKNHRVSTRKYRTIKLIIIYNLKCLKILYNINLDI